MRMGIYRNTDLGERITWVEMDHLIPRHCLSISLWVRRPPALYWTV